MYDGRNRLHRGGARRCSPDRRHADRHHVAERVLDADRSPADVAAEYDLDLADVFRALTYYYDNTDEMRAVRKRRTETGRGLREIEPPRPVPGEPTEDPGTDP